MKHRLSIIFVMIMACLAARGAVTADAVMDGVAKTFTGHPSTTVIFSLSSDGRMVQGNMTMCRERFTFSAGNMAVWFDGKTQWVLQRNAHEVNITEPTPAELMESNPLRILTSYKKHYRCTLLKAPQGQYKVQLTANTKDQYITSAVLTVNAKNYQPISMQATSVNGTATVKISAITHGKALPVSYFVYDIKADRTIEIIDLR